ncbi:Por secretion system C-terminal sorting domain-containing protein [Chryseobacterium piscicola]|uniref:Por secretion system C-terminal sorting domain-containing protein n=1 Tax=Chryseobacterium piscicola TaxID=551459 RepID=A0A1N7N7I7_9FLAO|nr:GEVED domain-containing protein [Chryseobacterium piscicola]PQA90166.1 hypothetical protein B0A70_14860 [Chryseobacterium piscicola]SIS94333.1 Por secretion system C-terminal sorting domain-containing protein [Chryseobacterium piscicola]
MKKALFSIASLTGIFGLSHAQHLECGTEDQTYEQFIITRDLADKIRANNTASKNTQLITYVAVQAHLIGMDDGTGYVSANSLNNALSELNRKFADINVQFYFKGTDFLYYPNSLYHSGNQTDAETLSFSQQNSSNNSMNLFLANSVKRGGSGVGGWSYVAPSSQSFNITWVVNGQLDDDKTTPHEFGHYFGLSHTFNNSTNATVSNRELVTRNFNEPAPRLSANCDTKGDFICDTPSDPRGNGNAAVTNCLYSGTVTDANADLFTPLVNNMMDYNFCAPYLFTNGQNDRMQFTGLPIVTNSSTFTLNAPETPQPVPTNITSTATDYSNQFALNWIDNSTVETGYLVEAKAEGSTVYIPVKGVMKNIVTANNFSKLTAGTKYNFRIKASNTKSNYSAETALIQFPALCGNNNITSCSPGNATDANWNIENVKITQNSTTLMQNLNSSCSSGSVGNYYATHIANIAAGTTVTLEAKAKASSTGSAYTAYVKVYVDWNKDNNFDETTEKVIQQSGFNGITQSFLIPSTVAAGSYRMRIALTTAGSGFTAATSCRVSFGEIEDYQLAISNGSLSTKEHEFESAGVYPNPVDDILYIQSNVEYKKFALYSAEGRLVMKGNVNDNKIDVSNLEKGYYVVEISDNKLNTVKHKILKK